MIYIISISEIGEDVKYTFFESTTESFFEGNKEVLKDLVNKKMLDERHMILIKGKTTKVWFHATQRRSTRSEIGSNYVLTRKFNKDTFRLIQYDNKNVFCKEIVIADRKHLDKLVSLNKVANCRVKEGKLECIGSDTAVKDIEFQDHIEEQYQRYITMSAMLGLKMSFEYYIEGTEVKLKRYTGESKRIIIPNFITEITGTSLYGKEIEALTLNHGLRAIGNNAFSGNKIAEVIIPDTVKFIGTNAFIDNRGLTKDNGAYTNKIKVLNPSTVTLDNYTTNLHF